MRHWKFPDLDVLGAVYVWSLIPGRYALARDLAAAVGIDEGQISRIRRGHGVVQPRTFEALADLHCGGSLDELVRRARGVWQHEGVVWCAATWGSLPEGMRAKVLHVAPNMDACHLALQLLGYTRWEDVPDAAAWVVRDAIQTGATDSPSELATLMAAREGAASPSAPPSGVQVGSGLRAASKAPPRATVRGASTGARPGRGKAR